MDTAVVARHEWNAGEPWECTHSSVTAFDHVDQRVLTCFPELVTTLGGDPGALLRQVGVKPRNPACERSGINYSKMVDLFALAAEELQCLDFGMQLASRQVGTIESPLRQIVSNSATLGEALGHVVSHSYAHSLAAAIWLRRLPSDEIVMVGHDILIDGSPDRRQAIEQIILLEYLTCLAATGGAARARRVEFRHQAVSPPACYRANFGCEVRFGQAADAIVFAEETLACPIAAPDPTECQRTIASIGATFPERKPPLHAAVRGVIMHLLGTDRCTNLNVAAALGLHVRRLHRGLAREGTSFQRIKNQVRRDLLIHYLDHTDLSIGEISERLGFAEQSAMTRFCRQSFESSPTERRVSVKSLRGSWLSKMGKSRATNDPKR